MWSRFGLFALFYFGVVNSISQTGGNFDEIKNARIGLPFLNESSYSENGQYSFGTKIAASTNQGESNRNERRTFLDTQGKNFGQYTDLESSTSKYNQNDDGSFLNRPMGESKQNVTNRYRQGSTGRPDPSELAQTSSNREISRHSNGFEENNQKHSFGLPNGRSSHSKDHERSREKDNYSSEFRPRSTGESSFGQSAEGSTYFTNHSEGDHHLSEFISFNEKDQYSRTTGESPRNQQTEFRPVNQNHPPGQGISQLNSHQELGHPFVDSESGQNHFSAEPNQQTGFLNNNETEVDKTEKEKEEEKEVCFTHLGCFKMEKPWKSILRPIGAPQSPEKIQTTINFYSRANLEKPLNITLYPQINMGEVKFEPRKITAIMVHGFSSSGNATWIKNMKNAYLKKVDANVMIVDWGKGAQLSNYLQVAGNTRVVGKQLGIFVKFLIEKFGADPGKFHLIGHSLGAQICSYLGKEVSGIARLTALDPAQPGFEGFDREVRLDKTDAEFVDVVHTDARPFIPTLGFGMIAPHGHVDFYMNGGFDQPGCIPPPKKDLPSIKSFLDFAKYPVEVIAKTVSCPHGRAYEYLIESFNKTDSCIFWGHKADVRNVFKSVTNTVTQGLFKKFTALSSTCSKEDCVPLGFVTKKSPLRGIFVVTTNGRSPYCISEPGVPPEIPPQERRQDSFIQKIGKKTGITG